MIKPPLKLDSALRDQILTAYQVACKQIGDEERQYVERKIERVLRRLASKNTEFHRVIRQYGETLYRFVDPSDPAQKRTSKKSERLIVAALFYLCNPYDVIPDYTPGTGYVDDAHVLNACSSEIRKTDWNLYIRLRRRLREAGA